MRLVLVLTVAIASAAVQQPTDSGFVRRDVMIPMRDGVRLHALVLRHRGALGNLPFLFTRTPYNCEPFANAVDAQPDNPLMNGGYILVCQDIRGKFQSEGSFVMLRPPRDRARTAAVDESSDAYDAIDWLVKNVADNNGRVGMLGTSYPGWLTVMAALEPHPALKAAAPMASPADMWAGDDFHHNGAFRLSYGFEYATMMESDRENTKFTFDLPDTYEWYLRVGSLATVNRRYLHEAYPTWNDFVAHPDYDAFWKRQAVVPQLGAVKVPTMNIAGWWDQEDFYGPITIYEALEKTDRAHQNFLVVGPWNHGGWNQQERRTLGPLDFGRGVSKAFRAEVLAPWFAQYLKDAPAVDLPEALTFETGANEWKRWTEWPPAGATATPIYLRADRKLAFEAPADAAAFDAYVSDPASPVPYRRRPILPTYGEGSTWSTWLTDDQRFLADRPDVVSWQTDALANDLVIAGRIQTNLFASTTGSDADWIVKLIDVYPDTDPMSGYQLMVANEVFRGRYRNSVERPEPIAPGAVERYPIDLHTQNYRFRRGHRVMVQVQSTWFPLIDRNPQTFVRNIFVAQPSDFKAATHRVYRSARYPSHIVLPVIIS
jgi:putative CocE/NonD family hydrolase